ncbi:uncharacterized protein LOC118435567 [Folsomia candida]|uniref:uncharacterized protein LOC118435567 n=1 Tax=Folsomia candida TaxID=158441 RepID=UPI001604E855|nr:uncharacterized protein LOC118435567 [Folsomia candida]
MGNLLPTAKQSVLEPIDSSKKIVDIIAAELQKDPIVLANWGKLAHSLELSSSAIENLRQEYSQTNNSGRLIRRMVEEWHSLNQNPSVENFCCVLKNENFKYVAEKIEVRKNPIDGERIQHSLGEAIRFHGRKNELQEIRKFYSSNRSPVYIHGPPGFGKTELAFCFCRNILESRDTMDRNANIIVLQGESEEKLFSSITKLWKEVRKEKVPAPSFHIDQINCLSNLSGKTIVVVDNVDDQYVGYTEVISRLKKEGCFVLVTTRNINCVDSGSDASYPSIDLEEFSRETAIEFVNYRLSGENQKDVVKLCVELGDWPLALVKAVAFIRHQKRAEFYGKSYNARQYCLELAKSPVAILLSSNSNEATLGKTLGLCIERLDRDQVDGSVAVRLLKVLAYVDGDGISLDSLRKIYQTAFAGTSTQDINNACKLLLRYSLIKSDNEIITVHRMTQKVLRLFETFEIPEGLKIPATLEILIDHLVNHMANFAAKDKFTIVQIWKHILDIGDEAILKKYISVPSFISGQLLELSFFSLTAQFCLENIRVLEKNFNNGKEMFNIRYNYSRSLSFQGDLVNSYNNLSNLLKNIEKCLGSALSEKCLPESLPRVVYI